MGKSLIFSLIAGRMLLTTDNRPSGDQWRMLLFPPRFRRMERPPLSADLLFSASARHTVATRCGMPTGLVRFRDMEYDEDKVDEIVLALLFLTFEETPYGARTWKGHDWNVLDRLHAKGYISDPRSKAKSVVVTEEGIKQYRAFFAKYFRKENH
jgi:hypothetical protein